MKALLAMMILFLGPDSAAQLKLPEYIPGFGRYDEFRIEPREELQGKIKHIVDYDFYVKTDPVTGKKIVMDTAYNRSGSWYDEYNNLLAETRFWKGKEEIYIQNLYDDKLRLIKSVDFKRGLTIDSVIYNEIENTITRYQNKHLQPRLSIYFFDRTGNLIRESNQYALRGTNVLSEEEIETYEYNNKNRLARRIYTNGRNATIFEYIDKDDMEIIRKYVQVQGKTTEQYERIIYLNEKTKVASDVSDGDTYYIDSLVTTNEGSSLYWIGGYAKVIKEITHFDKNNRIIIQFYPHRLPANMNWQYKLDSKGNWIEERTFENGVLFRFRKRIIEYFE